MFSEISPSTIFWIGAVPVAAIMAAAWYFWPAFLDWLDAEDPDIEDELDAIQNDFGMSMDRFGYVQDARNSGDGQ